MVLFSVHLYLFFTEVPISFKLNLRSFGHGLWYSSGGNGLPTGALYLGPTIACSVGLHDHKQRELAYEKLCEV